VPALLAGRLAAVLAAVLALALMLAALAAPAAASGPAVAASASAGSSTPPAAPPSEVARAVQALRSGTVYIAPGTARVDPEPLRRALDGASAVVVAVLPPAAVAQAGGEVAGLPGQIAAGLDRAGTVLVLVGRQVALASVGADQTVLGRALDTAQVALDRGPDTQAHVTAVLAELVRAARTAPSAFPMTSEQAPRRAGTPTAWTGYVGLLVLLVAAVAAAGWFLRRGRRRRPARPPRRRVHVDAAGRLISVEDVGPAAGGR
jgi:hypothetical protein